MNSRGVKLGNALRLSTGRSAVEHSSLEMLLNHPSYFKALGMFESDVNRPVAWLPGNSVVSGT